MIRVVICCARPRNEQRGEEEPEILQRSRASLSPEVGDGYAWCSESTLAERINRMRLRPPDSSRIKSAHSGGTIILLLTLYNTDNCLIKRKISSMDSPYKVLCTNASPTNVHPSGTFLKIYGNFSPKHYNRINLLQMLRSESYVSLSVIYGRWYCNIAIILQEALHDFRCRYQDSSFP